MSTLNLRVCRRYGPPTIYYQRCQHLCGPRHVMAHKLYILFTPTGALVEITLSKNNAIIHYYEKEAKYTQVYIKKKLINISGIIICNLFTTTTLEIYAKWALPTYQRASVIDRIIQTKKVASNIKNVSTITDTDLLSLFLQKN